MKNKNTLITILIILTTISITLFSIYKLKHIVNKKNQTFRGFERKLIPSPLATDTLNIKYSSYYFAGFHKEKLYLGNRRVYYHMLSINLKKKDTSHIKIKMNSDKRIPSSTTVNIDSSYVYIYDGTTSYPFILRGNTNTFQIDSTVLDSTHFINAIPTTKKSIILTTIKENNTSFIKVTGGKNHTTYEKEAKILKPQHEGIFSTDGVLHLNKKNNALIYVYFYRNEFISIDTNLNRLYTGNTIDTITQAKIKVTSLKNGRHILVNSIVTNQLSSTSGNYLYINSNILSKNEHINDFEKNDVIDVYDITNNGKYQYSFYIPMFKKQKMNSFLTTNDGSLIALYNNTLLFYQTTQNE